jgi:hypothetical protein
VVRKKKRYVEDAKVEVCVSRVCRCVCMVYVGVCVICLSLSPPLPPLPSLCVNHRYHEDVKVEVCLCLCLCLYVFVACELKSRALSHNPRHPPPPSRTDGDPAKADAARQQREARRGDLQGISLPLTLRHYH